MSENNYTVYLLISYRFCTSAEHNLVSGSQIINFFFFLMNGEVRLSAGGLYSLRARKAKYPRYRYIRLERHIRLNISRPSFKSRRREQKNNNIRPIYANWFYEMSFKSTSLIISGRWSSLAIKQIHRPNFCVSHRRNKMSFFRN